MKIEEQRLWVVDGYQRKFYLPTESMALAFQCVALAFPLGLGVPALLSDALNKMHDAGWELSRPSSGVDARGVAEKPESFDGIMAVNCWEGHAYPNGYEVDVDLSNECTDVSPDGLRELSRALSKAAEWLESKSSSSSPGVIPDEDLEYGKRFASSSNLWILVWRNREGDLCHHFGRRGDVVKFNDDTMGDTGWFIMSPDGDITDKGGW